MTRDKTVKLLGLLVALATSAIHALNGDYASAVGVAAASLSSASALVKD